MLSPLRYPGGKTLAVKTIAPYIPQGIPALCSPFAGGASLEIYIARDRDIPVIASDAYSDLVTFWQETLRDAPKVAAKVRSEFQPPMQKDVFYRLQCMWTTITELLYRAAAFFAINRSSFSGVTFSGGMSPNTPRFNESAIQRLETFSCPNLSVSEKDFADALEDNAGVFAYLDPPYDIPQKLYGNRGDMHAGFDHDRLAEVLRERSGWVMSYNDSPSVRNRYETMPGVKIHKPDWTHGMSAQGNRNGKEVLIVHG